MRKLAAIMFTDIVGYSALMSKDENQAMQVLQKNREILKSSIKRYNGEFVKEIGDGTLSIFQSSLDAVSCAVELQETLSRSAEWQLRIGIHIGDIVISEGDVFGDGVNIASRIQMLCEPGHVFVSERVYDDLRNKSDLSADNLGEKRLKNIDQPVGIYRITGKAAFAATPDKSFRNRLNKVIYSRTTLLIFLGLLIAISSGLLLVFKPTLLPGRDKVAIPIAVISFENQTGDKSLDYLQKAIPNLIITNLEQSKQVRTMTWERMQDILDLEGQKDVSFIDFGQGVEICRRENYPFIVVGSIVKGGDVFMTDAKVLDVESRQIITSVSSKGNGLSSILENQIDELSKGIIRSIVVSSRKFEEAGLPIKDITTNSMAAYEYFLQGREAYDKMYFEEALQFLEKAIQVDPGFSIAHLYLSYTYSSLGARTQQAEELEKAFITSARATEMERLTIQAAYAGVIQQNQLLQLSLLMQLAEKAPKDKRVFYSLGLWYRENGSADKSIEYFEKAVELDPNFGEAINQLAYRYFYKGNYQKAIECLDKYAALNPNDANPFDSKGDLYWQMGDLDRAIRNFKHALELKPDFYMSASKIAYIYAIKEDYRQAQYWMQKTLELTPNNYIRAVMLWSTAFYDYFAGRTGQALNILETFFQFKEEDPSHLVEMAYYWLKAHLAFDMGQYKDALALNENYLHFALMEPSNTPVQDSNGYFLIKGLCHLKMNDHDSALVCSEALKNLSNDPANDFNYQYLLRETRISLAQSFEELENLATLPQQIVEFSIPGTLIINVPFSKNSLAAAYARFDQSQKAILEYERLTTFDSTRTDRYLVNPRDHYFLGILFEKEGMREKAMEEFSRFLEIYADADQPNREISDAKRRLALLSGL